MGDIHKSYIYYTVRWKCNHYLVIWAAAPPGDYISLSQMRLCQHLGPWFAPPHTPFPGFICQQINSGVILRDNYHERRYKDTVMRREWFKLRGPWPWNFTKTAPFVPISFGTVVVLEKKPREIITVLFTRSTLYEWVHISPPSLCPLVATCT